MRPGLLAVVLVGACGGGPAAGPGAVGATPGAAPVAVAPAAPRTPTTTLVVDGLGAAPEDVDDHLHAPPTYFADLDRLYVEITSTGAHADVLRRSATAGLAAVPDTVSIDDGGDVELHLEVASLAPAPGGAACHVKIFVMRLPQHDLLAIADGRGRAMGRVPADACLATMSTAIVEHKLPPLLARQLDAKR